MITTDVDDNCWWLKFGKAIEDDEIALVDFCRKFRANEIWKNSNGIHGFMFFGGRFVFLWNNDTVEKSKQFTHTWKGIFGDRHSH